MNAYDSIITGRPSLRKRSACKVVRMLLCPASSAVLGQALKVLPGMVRACFASSGI
jgi:hypothetical protein